MFLFNIYTLICLFMNNQIKRLYLLIYDNTVLIGSTNLSDFLKNIKDEDIGFKLSISTLRTRFLENNRFSHAQGNRIYWLQKIDNDY
jgi:hypothetical protein